MHSLSVMYFNLTLDWRNDSAGSATTNNIMEMDSQENYVNYLWGRLSYFENLARMCAIICLAAPQIGTFGGAEPAGLLHKLVKCRKCIVEWHERPFSLLHNKNGSEWTTVKVTGEKCFSFDD